MQPTNPSSKSPVPHRHKGRLGKSKAEAMSNNITGTTWQEDPKEIIMLVNRTGQNYILELPSGRYRLDAGRRMRTLRSIMKVQQVKQLIDQGNLVVEA
jgi:hypothetical protein